MAQINPAQGYGSSYPNSGEVAPGVGSASPGAQPPHEEGNGILPEDAVHLKSPEGHPFKDFPRLSLQNYKQSVGQDVTFVKETLRNKVAEYGLPSQTKLNVSKDVFGNMEVGGHVQPDVLSRIQSDLNNNRAFKGSFDRMSVQEPTLTHLDTADKLSKAYGVGNTVVSAIVSENSEFNSLNDLAHRYQKYRETVSEGDDSGLQDDVSRFRFSA